MSTPNRIYEWMIGDVRVVRITDDDFALPSEQPVPGWAVPDLAPSTEETRIAFCALAIESAGTTVVVDPWLANDFVRDAEDAGARVDRLLGDLASVGIRAEDVDVVANSHVDGIGWNTRPNAEGDSWTLTFPNARYLYPAGWLDAGLEYAPFGELAHLTSIEPLTADTVLAAGVEMIEAPGHDVSGHMAVRIVSQGDLAIYPGHLILNVFDIAHPRVPSPTDPISDTTLTTRTALLDELAQADGILLTTLLGGSGGGRVRVEGDGYAVSPTTN